MRHGSLVELCNNKPRARPCCSVTDGMGPRVGNARRFNGGIGHRDLLPSPDPLGEGFEPSLGRARRSATYAEIPRTFRHSDAHKSRITRVCARSLGMQKASVFRIGRQPAFCRASESGQLASPAGRQADRRWWTDRRFVSENAVGAISRALARLNIFGIKRWRDGLRGLQTEFAAMSPGSLSSRVRM